MVKLNSLQKSKLGAIVIIMISALGVMIGVYDFQKYSYIMYASSAFLIGMIAYSYYIGREQMKRREENTRRKLR